MIDIRIDDDACVGCSLCVEVCPTKVFEFDEKKARPVVKKPKECFGCLSCSEICPATAIVHEGVVHSENHYYDPGAVELSQKTADEAGGINFPDDAGIRRLAVGDLGIMMLSVDSVFRQTLGGCMPAVGTMAGRTLATHLPRYHVPADFKEALAMVVEQLAPTWDLEASYDGAESLKITAGTCFIRDLCRREGLELGGDLCVLFYNYLAGYLAKLSGVRLKLEKTSPGDTCAYEIKVIRKE